MISKQNILGILKPFENKKTVVIDEQTTNDIIQGILQTHNFYKSEYDKIYKYFVGDSIEETCKNVYDFLKKYVPYYQEPEKKQTLRSPSAILSNAGDLGKNSQGADCKSYALFSCGIADAYRRNENKNFEVIYRFAGYNNKGIEHVFCVIKNKNKIWFVDNVLPTFDNRSKLPTNYKDYKIENMALVSLAGINYNQNYTSFGKRVESVGKVPKIYGTEDIFKIDFDKLLKGLQDIISFFANWNISDGEKMKKGFVEQGFTPNEMLLWYIVNKKDDWAFLHQAKEILIWDTPKINYNVADAFNTLINKPEWIAINNQYDVPFNLDITNKTPIYLPTELRGKNYVAAPNPNTGSGGGGNSSNAPAAKNNLLSLGLGAFLLFKFLG
jgi:hypothetical protein